jgi:hypothetical protein
VSPGLGAEIKYFGRHKGGSIRDGVILSLHQSGTTGIAPVEAPGWFCDSDEVLAAFHAYDTSSPS